MIPRLPNVPAPRERPAQLHALKAYKMSVDAHGYVRARADLFYRLIAESKVEVPRGPAIWISGDCHGENIGAVADAHGVATMDLNDLDETVIGFPAHDVIRLSLAISVASRACNLGGVETVQAIRALVEGYEQSLERRTPSKPAIALGAAPERFRKLMRRTSAMTRTKLFDRRVPRNGKGERAFAFGPRYWRLTKSEVSALRGLIATPEVRTLVTTLTDGAPDTSVELVDAAFRIAGTGSLGCWRAAALVRVGHSPKKKGKKRRASDDDSLRLLDVKEAFPSRAPRHPDAVTPTDDAERVVSGARALVPSFGERMVAASIGERRVVVRELMPQEQKVSLARMEPGEAEDLARYLGAIVGRAHARQLTPEQAQAWHREFGADESRKRGVPPSWLRESVIAQVATAEAEYLRHCAEFAATYPEVRK